MIHIGIDPGKSGGLAILYPSGDVSVLAFKDLTEADIWIDPFGQWVAMENGGEIPLNRFAMLELVHSMPKQGVASTFTFGQNFGMLRMALTASQTPYELVTPQKWQKALSCNTRGDKNVSKAMAQRLFPQIKITHAIADALLLAEYCRRTRVMAK